MNFQFLFDNPQIVAHFNEAVLGDQRSAKLSLKLRIYYSLLRPTLPVRWRRIAQRSFRHRADNRWYLPEQFFSGLNQLLSEQGAPSMIHPWPGESRFGFVLTHDVESIQGMHNILAIAELEESLGFRSSWNFVPHDYYVDPGILRELQQRGFEVGVHGYNHDGRLFASKRIFDRRAEAIRDAGRRFGATGFRAPMMHRNIEWLQELGFDYDGSFFDADPFQPMPGGIGMVWPFLAGNLVVLPNTLPQDHTLFVVLNEQGDHIWRDKLAFLKRAGGLALMLNHPDYLSSQRRKDIYRGFLEHVRGQGDFWHGLPRETAQWWRMRDQSRMENDSIVGPAADQGVISYVSSDGRDFEFSTVCPAT